MKKVGMVIIGIVMLFVIWYFGGMVYYSYFDNEPDPYAVYFKDNNFLFLEYGEDMDFSEALDLKIVNSNSSAGGELYSQNRENKKSFGAIYPPKDFF